MDWLILTYLQKNSGCGPLGPLGPAASGCVRRCPPAAVTFFWLAFALAWLAGCSPGGPGALLRGRRLLDKGDYAGAVAQFERAAALLSTNAQAWNYLGVAYHKTGQTANAQEAYQRALKLNPDLTIVHYNLGCLLLEENRPETLDAAQNEFTAFVLRQGGAVEGWLKLGTSQLRLGRLPSAEGSFREALKLAPQNPEALNDLGLILLERRRYRDASAYFAAALRQQPDYAPAMLNLAVADLYQNNRQQALDYYHQYLALNPRPAQWEAVSAAAQQLDHELAPAASSPSLAENRPFNQTATNARSAANEPSRLEPSNLTVRTAAPRTEPVRVANNSDAKSVPLETTTIKQPTEAGRPARKGFLQKLNPLNLFEPAAKPESRAEPPSQVVIVPPDSGAPVGTPNQITPLPKPRPVPVVVARYPYLATGKPAEGRRTDAEFYLAQGQEAQRGGRLKDALANYHAATQADPGYFDAQMALGAAAYQAGGAADLPLALRGYETAVAIDPDSFAARYGFALALKKANYFRDAADQLETLLAAHSAGQPPEQLAALHLTLGKLYAEQLRQTAEARAHYLKVLQLEPENPQAIAIRYWLQDNAN